MNLHHFTAHQALEKISTKQTSAKDILAALGKKIAETDSTINAYVRISETPVCPSSEASQKASQEASQKASPSQTNQLPYPVPIAIKDNICIRGHETTCSSRILKGFIAPYDATVVERLQKAGVPIHGQTNMDEFAFGSSTETSCYGPSRNPWNPDCVPGGSSGGSAAAVGAHEAIWALGSDTGGSIRQPASFCGVVGMKPTYGRVSRYGLLAFASSLDQIGPITKDVADAALLMNIIAGYDPRDSTSADIPVPDYTRSLIKDIKGLKIGIPKEYFMEGIDPEVNQAVQEALQILKNSGATIRDVSLPHTEYCVATYYIVATAEASSNLARYDGVQYGSRHYPAQPRRNALIDMYEETRTQGFGKEAKRRIMLGTYALSSGYYDAYYLRGQKVRTLIKSDFENVFCDCDALITPTSPTTAFRIGEKMNDPLAMYLSDILTISANLSGIPAISVPCGFSKAGLPIGLQIMTKAFDEETLFRVAYTYEQNTEWHKQKAPLA